MAVALMWKASLNHRGALRLIRLLAGATVIVAAAGQLASGQVEPGPGPAVVRGTERDASPGGLRPEPEFLGNPILLSLVLNALHPRSNDCDRGAMTGERADEVLFQGFDSVCGGNHGNEP